MRVSAGMGVCTCCVCSDRRQNDLTIIISHFHSLHASRRDPCLISLFRIKTATRWHKHTQTSASDRPHGAWAVTTVTYQMHLVSCGSEYQVNEAKHIYTIKWDESPLQSPTTYSKKSARLLFQSVSCKYWDSEVCVSCFYWFNTI